MTCSRKSITVSHESGIALMSRKPPNQQQKAATSSVVIHLPEAVVQTMRAREKPAPMSFAEAQERIARELHLPSVHPVVTQAPRPVQQQQAPSRPVQQAPEPSPWGTRPAGSKGLPAERLAERLAAPGGRISFKEAAARLKKETGLNIFGGK
jgi:hypothetical protein